MNGFDLSKRPLLVFAVLVVLIAVPVTVRLVVNRKTPTQSAATPQASAPVQLSAMPSLQVLPSKPVQLLPDGASIRLVAITSDKFHSVWWAGNGQTLGTVSADNAAASAQIYNPGGTVYRALLTARGLSETSSFSLVVPTSPSTSLSLDNLGNGHYAIGAAAIVTPILSLLGLQIGVDNGPWMTLVTHRVDSDTFSSSEFGIRQGLGSYAVAFSPITEVSGLAALTVQVSENVRFNNRTVAVTNSGKEVVGEVLNKTVSNTGPSNAVVENVLFRGLSPADIASIRVDYRLYHFAEFDNLPLQPLRQPKNYSAQPTVSLANMPVPSVIADGALPPLNPPRQLIFTPAQWHYWLGEFYQRKNIGDAVGEFRSAVSLTGYSKPIDLRAKLSPDSLNSALLQFQALEGLGGSLYAKGSYSAAVGPLQQAAAFHCADGTCLLLLGDALYKTGARSQAEAVWQQCASQKDSIGDTSAAEAQQILTSISSGKMPVGL